MPYDRFVKLQIAADLIEKDDADRVKNLPALGFFGLGAQYYKNTDAAKAAADELDDRVDTLTRGLLGLTVSCARCHDHKFDPIPTAGLLFAGRRLQQLQARQRAAGRQGESANGSRRRSDVSRSSTTSVKDVHAQREVGNWPRRQAGEMARYLMAALEVSGAPSRKMRNGRSKEQAKADDARSAIAGPLGEVSSSKPPGRRSRA